MEVLSPELMWVGQRCYRVNIPNENRLNEVRERIDYEEEDFNCEIDDEDFYEMEIHAKEDGKFQLEVHVPQIFHAQVIGSKGATKKRLEQETSCQITVPKIGSKDTKISIKSTSKKNILSAKNRLDLIVFAGRSKTSFTHFLSIAFTTKEIQANFSKFKKEILNDPEIFGIDDSLFQTPFKLHLTIATISLLDNEDRILAAELLQDCKDLIIDRVLQGCNILKVKMIGLNYMNDDPMAVDVLYAKVVSEELQQICNDISDYFASRGLVQHRQDQVKMHVTLINSLFRDNDDAFVKEANSQSREDRVVSNRTTFDASKILKKFKDFYFGELIIQEIHLSQRYSKSNNGYYESTGILKL